MPVTIDYKFNTEDKSHAMEIIKKKSNFPVTQKVTFDNKVGDCSLLVRYSDSAPILAGLPREIAKYDIKAGKLKHAGDRDHKFKFVLMISNNIHQIPCLENAQLIEDWTEVKSVPKAKPAQPAQPAEEVKKPGSKPGSKHGSPKGEEPKPTLVEEFDIKTSSKSITTSVGWETSSYALTPDQRKAFKDTEEQMRQSDEKFLIVKRVRSELEAYSYLLKRNLKEGGVWVHFMDKAASGPLLEEVAQTICWIDEDDDLPLLDM